MLLLNLADWSRKNLTIYDILNLNIVDFKNEILTNNEWIADWFGDPISHEQTKEKNIK